MIWAVVLAGGAGSRFWPLSTPDRPKQLLPLVSDQPLLVDTLRRLRDLVPPERTLVLTNAALFDAVVRAADELPGGNVIAEPKPAGTAAALAWAAMEIHRRGGAADVMVSVHADWAIGDSGAFLATLRAAAKTADASRSLVTVGVVPSRDDPGFGYVVPGPARDGAHHAGRFVEKPTRERAAELRSEGALWNSGIFAWRVDVLLEQLERHTPEVAPALSAESAGEFFAAARPVSIDVGLLERSADVLVIAGDFGWDDVGTWGALLRLRARDARGNVTHGSVYAVDAADNVVHADGPAVVLYGVEGLVVVTTGELTLVTTAERSGDLKALLEELPAGVRERR